MDRRQALGRRGRCRRSRRSRGRPAPPGRARARPGGTPSASASLNANTAVVSGARVEQRVGAGRPSALDAADPALLDRDAGPRPRPAAATARAAPSSRAFGTLAVACACRSRSRQARGARGRRGRKLRMARRRWPRLEQVAHGGLGRGPVVDPDEVRPARGRGSVGSASRGVDDHGRQPPLARRPRTADRRRPSSTRSGRRPRRCGPPARSMDACSGQAGHEHQRRAGCGSVASDTPLQQLARSPVSSKASAQAARGTRRRSRRPGRCAGCAPTGSGPP